MRFSIFLDCQSTVYCDLITGKYLPSRQVYSIILWFCEFWFLAPFWSRRFPPLSWLAQDRNHVPDEMDWPATMSTAFVFNWQIGAASSFMSLLWGRVCERHLFVEMERFPRLTPKYKKKERVPPREKMEGVSSVICVGPENTSGTWHSRIFFPRQLIFFFS